MVWSAARGGMRSVVEAYEADGFLERQNVHLIAAYEDGSFIHRQLLALRALASFTWCLLTNRVELVHVHTSMRGSFWRKGLFSSIARLFGVPVVLHMHGSEFRQFYAAQPSFAQKLIKRHLEKAACVMVLSESWRDYVSGIAPAATIRVVPNYVTMPAVNEVETKSQDILFLGLIGDRKGTFDLIDAFGQIAPVLPDARLLIGGNGEIDRARARADELRLGDKVQFLGWIDGGKRSQLLASSALYVLPSYNEGLPMSVLEAMAAGLPVITTRVGGLPELITSGENGVLIDAGDKVDLARWMTALLTDNDLRVTVAEAGRDRIAKDYSDAIVLPRLAEIYRDFSR